MTQRLLLVDDQPANIRVLAEALAGYELSFATDGQKALELARAGGVDLILLDVVMPELDGFEVCRRLKSDARTERIPVIFVTARGDVDDEANGFDAGGVDYITKPVSPAIVRARVKTHLELKRQQEVLREVDRISRHDLKTPIGSIISFASMLADDERCGAEQRSVAARIEQAGYRLLEMVNRSLDLFKMEQKTYRVNATSIDLRRIAERVVEDLGARCEIRGSASAWGEELLTYSMLANVIKNAVEACADDVTIELEEGARVRVRNRGAVPAELRPRFFEKYATGGKRGGTGLGTYSARLMAETQGGSIALDARDDETIVTISLPRAEATTDRVVLARPARILIADDDESTRTAMRMFLARPQWTVDEASDGAVASEKFANGAYDFVFMDLEMPVAGGMETVSRMRGGRATLVALSSHDDEETRGRALAAGFDVYLTKPATREKLMRVVGTEVVRIDPEIAEIVPQFLEGKRDEIARLRISDERAVEDASHRLRGSFKLYGFDEAARLCGAIEKQAADRAAVGQLLDELARHLETMRIEYAR